MPDDTDLMLSGHKPTYLYQFLTALAACMGGFTAGCILGYSSPVSPMLQEAVYGNSTEGNITSCPGQLSHSLDDTQISWFSSTASLGPVIGAPLGGYLIKVIGRRSTMVATILPYTAGWVLIGMARNFPMLISGRLLTGVAAGAVCVSVPTYIAEIASPNIRGILGTGFQEMVVLSIFYTYGVGSAVCWQWLALACFIPSGVFSLWMFFNPESPTYLMAKQQYAEARKALKYLRGSDYDVQPEMDQLQRALDEQADRKASIADLCKPYVLKPLSMSLLLMFFQQTCGINAILFNLDSIFDKAHSSLSSDASSMIVAGVQVLATTVSVIFIDKAGRKPLLMASSAVMGASLATMGTYFYFEEQGNSDIDSLGWLPLVSLIVFISFFSFGYGPIPWLMMSELFSADVRELASTIATVVNWSLSFAVALLFQPLIKAIDDSGVYWLFSGICAVNFLFCVFVVKETKGKTTEEITAMFGGPNY